MEKIARRGSDVISEEIVQGRTSEEMTSVPRPSNFSWHQTIFQSHEQKVDSALQKKFSPFETRAALLRMTMLTFAILIMYCKLFEIFNCDYTMHPLLLLLMSFFPIITLATHPTHEFYLHNGLKIIVREDHRTPVVVTQLWYKVGSSYETLGYTGISHALEHMMFRGTPTHPGNSFSTIISQNGGIQNATTMTDATAYYQEIAKDKLPQCFALEADRMQNAALKKEDFAKEIQVVMEERRLNDDQPQFKTFERFSAVAFLSTSYRHQPIGWMNDIQHLTANDLRAWYQKWYAPNNATLVVIGDVDPEQVHALAEKYFGTIPSRPLPTIKPEQEINAMGARQISVHAHAEVPWLVMGYQVPSLNTTAESWQPYALDVVASLLDGGSSGRFQKELVRKSTLATDTSVGYEAFARLSPLFTLSGIPTPEHSLEELKTAFLQQISQLQNTLVSKEELDRVKAQVIAQKYYKNDSLTEQAHEIGLLESTGLSWQIADNYEKNIEQITPEQIQAVARQYLTEDRLTIANLIPEK